MATYGQILLGALAVLSSASSVAAEPEPGTVAMKFQRVRREATESSLLSRRQSGSLSVNLYNEITYYLVNVTMGNPPQALTLLVDTGSSDTWVPATTANVCPQYCQYGTYDYTESTTYRNLTNYPPFQISYVDRTYALGNYFQDTLTLGGTNINSLTMAQVFRTNNVAQGIMGIGYAAGESLNAYYGRTYPNVLDVMKSQGLIQSRSYSLWLDDLESETGVILFGGVDKDKYVGQLVSLPIQPLRGNVYAAVTVAWTGFTVTGGGQVTNLSPSAPSAVILDSGTSLTLLPDDTANRIFNGLGTVTSTSGGQTVPCDYANTDLYFTFTFGGSGGATVNVTISEFIVPLGDRFRSGPYAGRQRCQVLITPASGRPLLFGDSFLRSAYVVYNLDTNQIAMAQTNYNSNRQNIDVVSSAIPDVVSTASVASVAATTASGIQVGGGTSGSIVSGGATRTATFSLVSGTASVAGGTATAASGSGASNGATSGASSTATRTGAADSSLRSPSWSMSTAGIVAGVVTLAGIMFGSGVVLL